MIWYESDNPNGFVTGKRFSVDAPCVTMMAEGMGGDSRGHWHLWTDGRTDGRKIMHPGKPPYCVPSMAEVAAIPWNGLKVVSTFSGAGGSCTGYRMAGYRVVWANEFVPAAQDSYRANMAPGSILDPRDIRTVTAEDILSATGLAVGELDLFDGSPPCQAFSMAGKRAKGWGKDRHYEHGASQKNEQLFDEYIRLLGGLQPRAFVAENVSGLVKGVAKGFFLDILKGLKACGYRVEARLLDAQWLGVPQTRQRIIFVGVREDLGKAPAFPKPLSYRYSVRDALPELMGARSEGHGYFDGGEIDIGAPAQSVPARRDGAAYYHHAVQEQAGALFIEGANGYNGHASRSVSLPPATIQSGRPVAIVHPSGRGAGRVDSITAPDGAVMARVGGVGGMGPGQTLLQEGTTRRKFTIAEVKRICAFPDDYTLTGSYAQQWERLGNSVPPVMMYHIAAAIRDHVFEPAP